jgi:outer membrane protein
MKATLIFFLTIAAVSAYGQTVTGTNQISLDEAIRIALDKNYDTRSAGLGLESAQISKTQANDNLLPDATATGSYDYNKPLSATTIDPFTGGRVVGDATHTLRYSIQAGINLYNGGFNSASIHAAEYKLDAARYNLKWVRQSVAFNVTSAYITALRYKELLVSAQTTYSQDSALMVRVQAQYDAGAAARTAVYQQQSVLGQDELTKIQAANNYDNALADLLFLLDIAPNISGSYDVSLKGIDTSLAGIKSRGGDLQASPSTYDDLLQRREDLAAQRSNILAQQEGISITRSALLPSLDASFGIGGSGTNTDIANIPFSHSLGGGLNLRIPLFDRMQTRLQIDIEKVQIDQSKVELNRSEEQFRNQIALAENNLRSSQQAVDASDRALVAAEESLRAATEKLRVGAGIQVDVIVAEGLASTARVNHINAVYNYLLSVKQLEYLLGRTNY